MIIISLLWYLIFIGINQSLVPPMTLSVSSDGRYVISAHAKSHDIILWDIKNKSSRIISHNGNIFSAYFIKHTHDFIWQDLNNRVVVENTDGKIIDAFLMPPSIGQVMTSDLKHYYASDKNWSILDRNQGTAKYLKPYTKASEDNYIGYQKHLNLMLSSQDQYLLSAGFGHIQQEDGVVLWGLSSCRLRWILSGQVAKTIATISPDDHYIVSGDENMSTVVWDVNAGRKSLMLTPSSNMPILYDQSRIDANFAIKFIDMKGHFLVFITYKPYAILYSVYHPRPIKYFYLGLWPRTVNMSGDYVRNGAIDSSPQANILVVGKQYQRGIIVYHFDPEKLTLKKIWIAGA